MKKANAMKSSNQKNLWIEAATKRSFLNPHIYNGDCCWSNVCLSCCESGTLWYFSHNCRLHWRSPASSTSSLPSNDRKIFIRFFRKKFNKKFHWINIRYTFIKAISKLWLVKKLARLMSKYELLLSASRRQNFICQDKGGSEVSISLTFFGK